MQIAQLLVHDALGLLGALDGLCLESLDGLDLAADIVRLRLEGIEATLDLVDDGGVLQHGSIVREVDRLGLLLQGVDLAAGVIVALLEGLEGGSGLAFEAQLRADLRPVDLEGGAALLRVKTLALMRQKRGCH